MNGESAAVKACANGYQAAVLPLHAGSNELILRVVCDKPDSFSFVFCPDSPTFQQWVTQEIEKDFPGQSLLALEEYVTLESLLRAAPELRRLYGAKAFRREAVLCEGDRDPLDVVLRRTSALLADLTKGQAKRDLGETPRGWLHSVRPVPRPR